MTRLLTAHRAVRHGLVRPGVRGRLRAWTQQPERGDVPGWVLVTVMTAGLVAALWLVAEPLLTDLFASSVSGVTGQ